MENIGSDNYGFDEESEKSDKSAEIWGAVIKGVQYGELIAKKQEIDWSEYYPLHVVV